MVEECRTRKRCDREPRSPLLHFILPAGVEIDRWIPCASPTRSSPTVQTRPPRLRRAEISGRRRRQVKLPLLFAHPSPKSTEVDIRILGAKDVGQFATVAAESFCNIDSDSSSLYARQVRVQIMLSQWLSMLVLRPLLCFCAVSPETGRVCGVAELAVDRVWDGKSWIGYFFAKANKAHIRNLAVLKAARRKGIASRLVERCEMNAQMLGFDKVYLHVEKDNPGAQALYRALGYTMLHEDVMTNPFEINAPALNLLEKRISTIISEAD